MPGSGTAQGICAGIRAAGYSPHDYIYRVLSYTTRVGPSIDYTHHAEAPDVIIYRLPVTTFGGSINDVGIVDSGLSGGTVTDLQGNAIPDGNPALANQSGLDGYIYTATDGTVTIYRDQPGQVIRSAGQTQWTYIPNWSGPDGARMSSIWRSVGSCAQ